MKFLSMLFTLSIIFTSMVNCRANQQMPGPTSNPASTPLPTVSPSPTRKPTRTPRPTPTPIQYNKPWEVINQIHYSHNLYLAGFLSDVYGITVGDGGEVHYTNDGGQNWPKAKNQSMCRFGLDIVDELIAWNCGNGAGVLVTTDGGKVWTPVAIFGGNEPDHCRFLRFLDGTTGWAATPTQLAITNDGGKTWQREYLPIKNESSLYLANDGKLLTITDAFDREITVLRYQD